jgi:hypothetical protein
MFAGIREGALQIAGTNGDCQLTTYLYGIGAGPQVTFASGQAITVANNLGYAYGVGVDGFGNVFISDGAKNEVFRVPAGGGAPVPTGNGFNQPEGLAVDGAGNVYVSDYYNFNLKELPNAGSISLPVGTPCFTQVVAVDAKGNVFYSDLTNSRVAEIPAGGGPVTAASNMVAAALAVDNAGNLFIADSLTGAIWKVAPGTGVQTQVCSVCWASWGLAVDAAGDVFYSSGANVWEILAAGGEPAIVAALNTPAGLAFDAAGDLFIANGTEVIELPLSQAPQLQFTTPVGFASATQSLTIANAGNAPWQVTDLTIAAPFRQMSGGGPLADCSSSSFLSPGTACNLSIDFYPKGPGIFNGPAMFSGQPVSQSIPLTGLAAVGEKQ